MFIVANNKALATSRSAVSRLERSRRQVILMRIIEEQQGKKKNPTFEQFAVLMRENNWVSARWPDYSMSMASYDYGHLMDIVKDDIKVLAMPYFVRQMEIIDETVDILSGIVQDNQMPIDTRIKAANTLGGYADRYMKIFGNVSPSESYVEKVTLSGDLDSFNRMKEEADKELQSREPIEGEWEKADEEQEDKGQE